MPPVEFEPIIPANEWPLTHALDHADTAIGKQDDDDDDDDDDDKLMFKLMGR
jgi:hypothetical protein